jgi:DNA gyrase subunit A
MAYKNVHSGGIIALGLKDGDELITCRLVDEGDHVVLVSKEGQSIRFQEDETRPMGRGASGVFGMRFRENDELIAMEIIPKGTPDEGSLKLLTVTKKGYGKRTELGEYPIQGRGGKGVITIKTTERNGDVVSACLLDEGDQIIVITDHGQLIRTNAREISVYSRNTQGVRIMNIEGDEKIVSVARVKEEDIDDEDEVTAVPEGQVPPEIEAEEPVEETDAEPGAEENISSEEE